MEASNRVTPFLFEGEITVRVIERDGAPWFVATDVCAVLNLTSPTKAVEPLDEDERSKFNLGRPGEATIISESGLYTLILRSRNATKPGTIAYRFRKWVTAEVLPALRRTGTYMMPGAPSPDGAVDAATRPLSQDAAVAAWLALPPEERRERRQDALLYFRAVNRSAARWFMWNAGFAIPPRYLLGAVEQFELDIGDRANTGRSVTIIVPQGGAPN